MSNRRHPFEKPLPRTAVSRATVVSPPGRQLWAGALLNPIKLADAPVSWKAVLAAPALAFALFFFQAGLDQMRVGLVNWSRLVWLPLAGGVFGLALPPLAGGVGWAGARLFGSKQPLAWAVRAFCLAYVPALVYGALGLAANLLFDWRTAVTFGVTGVLWSLGPMLAALRRMTGSRLGVSLFLTTVCGLLTLLAWAWLGGM